MKTMNNFTEVNKTLSLELPLAEMSVITAFYVLLILAALIGNSLILTAFTVNKKLRTITHTLVMGLALSDILVGLVSIPCWMFIDLSQYNSKPNNNDVTRFYSAFDIFIGIASILQLTCISMERCHAVVRPIKHRTLSKHVFYIMVCFPWFYAALMGFLHPLQYQAWESSFTILMFTTGFFIPFMIIFIAYFTIYRYTRRKSDIIQRNSIAQKRLINKELKLSITIAFITSVFVITWLPLFVVTVIATYSLGSLGGGMTKIRLVKFVKWMHYSNSAINPYIYSYRNEGIRTTLKVILSRVFCREYLPSIHKQDSAMSTITWKYLSSKRRKPRNGDEETHLRIEVCSSV